MNNTEISTFFSYGDPHNDLQEKYIQNITKLLIEEGIVMETLGKSFWSIRTPLDPIRDKMNEVHGAVILSLERFHSNSGTYKEYSKYENKCKDQYFTSVWSHIEAAMAYQNDLPLLILKEKKLHSEGMIDDGVHGWMVVRINGNKPDELFEDPILSFIKSWIELVREHYYKNK